MCNANSGKWDGRDGMQEVSCGNWDMGTGYGKWDVENRMWKVGTVVTKLRQRKVTLEHHSSIHRKSSKSPQVILKISKEDIRSICKGHCPCRNCIVYTRINDINFMLSEYGYSDVILRIF